MCRLVRFILAGTLVLSVAGGPENPAQAQYAPGNYSRHHLQSHQGRYFRWSIPPGWRARESDSGVTLTSPDGRYNASLVLLLRSRGATTPAAFLLGMLRKVPYYRHVQIISSRRLPNERMSYQTWHFIEALVSYTDNGLPVTGLYRSGVANYGNQRLQMNDAMIVGYRAATNAFQQAQAFMPAIAKSIVLTNAAEANGNITIIHPRNNPWDSSPLIKSWQEKNKVYDRVFQKQADVTRGVERVYDPQKNQVYTVPNGWYDNTYNANRGAYNMNNLQRVPNNSPLYREPTLDGPRNIR
jgi:hypothetical protein